MQTNSISLHLKWIGGSLRFHSQCNKTNGFSLSQSKGNIEMDEPQVKVNTMRSSTAFELDLSFPDSQSRKGTLISHHVTFACRMKVRDLLVRSHVFVAS